MKSNRRIRVLPTKSASALFASIAMFDDIRHSASKDLRGAANAGAVQYRAHPYQARSDKVSESR
jgi:hypothetical protein